MAVGGARNLTHGDIPFPNALPIVDAYIQPVNRQYPDNQGAEYVQQYPSKHANQFQDELDDSYDEAQSLLDLANAYISMGDKQEAIDTLKEAVARGSGLIRQQAQKTLDSLD